MDPAQLDRNSKFEIRNSKFFKKGFTLTELLIVIGVIGVLAGITYSVMNPLSQFQKARDSRRKQDLANIQKALELYYNDNNRYPTVAEYSTLDDSPNPYIQALPDDQAPRTYRYDPEAGASPQTYRLYAGLERCSTVANCNDEQHCTTGNISDASPDNDMCGGATGNCGTGILCTYSITSSNTTP